MNITSERVKAVFPPARSVKILLDLSSVYYGNRAMHELNESDRSNRGVEETAGMHHIMCGLSFQQTRIKDKK